MFQFIVNDKVVKIDDTYMTRDSSVIPRVQMSRTCAEELQKSLGAKGRVYFGSSTYTPVRCQPKDGPVVVGMIASFLYYNSSLWFS